MDSSSEELEDLNCVEDGDLDNLDADFLDDSVLGTKKPHFLDYVAAPPTGAELQYTGLGNTTEYPTNSTESQQPENDLDKNNANEKQNSLEINSVSIMSHVDQHPTSLIMGSLKSSSGGSSSSSSTGAKKKSAATVKSAVPAALLDGNDRRFRDPDTTYEQVPIVNCHKRFDQGPEKYMSSSMTSYDSLGQTPGGGISLPRGTWPDAKKEIRAQMEMGPKVECVYSLLSMLGSHDIKVTASKFLELSKSPETCATLRRSGCIPLFVQMIHSDSDEQSRKYAAQALHNVVHCHPDDKAGRRESQVLKLIEAIMDYCEYLKATLNVVQPPDAIERDHPSKAIFSLMKVSFDEEHRHAMCHLGALQAIASLVHMDHAAHGVRPSGCAEAASAVGEAAKADTRCVSLRRYAGMALTNLTFGDGNNKALLCANKEFMKALVAQLDSDADDLVQVTASVLRNLSWRADNNMIQVLNEIGTVTALATAAMRNNYMENTLKAILSALWNLSAHCSSNKAEFCRVHGALAFLVEMLMYEAASKTLTIIENAGGILRNVSSHIAVREDYRQILRERDCLGILLQQLRSESLTVVSNACGTLWNLSARCPTDQKYLWDNGAVPMLRSLIHSKHKMISNGSNAALKNLLNYRPGHLNQVPVDSVTKSLNLKALPSLSIRKQRALEQELDKKLSDTCEIIDMAVDEKVMVAKGGTTTGRDRRVAVSRDASTDESVSIEHGFVQTRTDDAEQVMEKRKTDDANNGSDATVESANDKTVKKDRQEATEMDQITDYSLRYAENQLEVDEEDGGEGKRRKVNKATNSKEDAADEFNGNEIILILEDSVKCYQEEGTPYIISNATSMTDLRLTKEMDKRVGVATKPINVARSSAVATAGSNSVPQGTPPPPPSAAQQKPRKSLGQQTPPERPVNYCEEGTPGCFSRDEFSRTGSLSSLEGDAPAAGANNEATTKVPVSATTTAATSQSASKVEESPGNKAAGVSASGGGAMPKHTPIDYAQETPLMFSRTSSMESLASAAAAIGDSSAMEPGACVDDAGSVISEFSRVASGIVSPSDLPDSPTAQSVPQSPSMGRRRRMLINGMKMAATVDEVAEDTNDNQKQVAASVFHDKVDRFEVENTPAQFSCATSLSNLSMNDGLDEPVAVGASVDLPAPRLAPVTDVSDPDDDDDAAKEGDDELLDTCINMGINKGLLRRNQTDSMDAVQQYYTEDTPAHLSKAGSNSNLSVLSMLDQVNQCEIIESDDNSSDGVGENGDDGEDLLEQCIQNGIEKSIAKAEAAAAAAAAQSDTVPLADRKKVRPHNDSLSSLSIDDSDGGAEDGILEEAIAAGLNRIRQPEFNIGARVTTTAAAVATASAAATGNESISSVDSCESGLNDLLLEQCIQSGINKRVNGAANVGGGSGTSISYQPQQPQQYPQQHQSYTNRVPTAKIVKPVKGGGSGSMGKSAKTQSSSRKKAAAEDQLLLECINMGIEKNVKRSAIPMRNAPPVMDNSNIMMVQQQQQQLQLQKQQELWKRMERMTMEEKYLRADGPEQQQQQQLFYQQHQLHPEMSENDCINRQQRSGTAAMMRMSKNGNGASVAKVIGPATATMVMAPAAVAAAVPSQGNSNGEMVAMRLGRSSTSSANAGTDAPNGDRNPSNDTNNNNSSSNHISCHKSIINSINGFDREQLSLLAQSNESQALKLSATMDDAAAAAATSTMIISNECMIEGMSVSEDGMTKNEKNLLNTSSNKHKDPDLMLKSVDRLTQALVSTAEFLRSQPSDGSAGTGKKSMSQSINDDTWNENTCPNGGISFPSCTYSAPKLSDSKRASVGGGNVGVNDGADDDDDDDDTLNNASLSFNNNIGPEQQQPQQRQHSTGTPMTVAGGHGSGGGGETTSHSGIMLDCDQVRMIMIALA